MTPAELIKNYQQIRQTTETLCNPLVIEDYVIQSNEDVSPPKWHLAHTTWFFETFILARYLKNYRCYHSLFKYLFNSYYQHIGDPYPRIKRGILSRPTVTDIYRYRQYVDNHIYTLLNKSFFLIDELTDLIILGLNHEQQHQELLLTDIKHNFFLNPDYPCYQVNKNTSSQNKIAPLTFLSLEGGIITIGYQGKEFCFDNELPHHQVILKPYQLANRLITNGEYLEFIQAKGYEHATWWLADGWEMIQKNHYQAPLYWLYEDGEWYIFTLSGLRKLNLDEPVVHLSYYEADAYARFCGKRLPFEAEWENFVNQYASQPNSGNFLEQSIYHPTLSKLNNMPQQLFGDAWEWTASSYSAYPGYQPLTGALGEYNGKFMNNQMVLRGGSCLTPLAHIRNSYRNFFQPGKRWQFTGIRLASD